MSGSFLKHIQFIYVSMLEDGWIFTKAHVSR